MYTSFERNRPMEFYKYDSVEHNFFMTKLELKKQIGAGRLLRKTDHQKPFYFLIDEKFETSRYLYHFSEKNSFLRVYDIQKDQHQTFYDDK